MHRNYPLVDSMIVTAQAPQGVYLPSSFMVDMQLIVPYVEGIDPARFFVSSIVRNATSFQVTIGYMTVDPGTSTADYGFDCAVSGAIPVDLVFGGESTDAEHTIPISAITTVPPATDNSYQYGIPADYAAMRGMRGSLYIGTCADMTNINAMKFRYQHSAIMQTCVYFESKEAGLESIRIVDSYTTNAKFTDDVTLTIGRGIKATVVGNEVRLDLDERAIVDKLNELLRTNGGIPIKRINGILPDAFGNFTLAGEDCTLITNQEAGVSISNPCSKPCCDQNGIDSAEVTQALTELLAAKDVLNNYYTDLATKVNLMQARLSSLIASRK